MTGMRRRPSGEPPPLPHGGGRRGWIGLFVALALVGIWLLIEVAAGAASVLADLDADLLDVLVVDSGLLADVAKALQHALDPWVIGIATVVLLGGLLFFKRLRILVVVGVALVVVDALVIGMQLAISAPRPYDVVIRGSWTGYASPSVGLGHLTVLVVALVLGFAPPGRARTVAGVIGGVGLALVAWAGVALATDYPSPAVMSVVFPAVLVIGFMWRFAPDSVAPVKYGTGTAAHLDLGGARGDAIRTAVQEQLGLTVTEIEPFGLEGSGGSSPMRLHIESRDGGPSAVFAKLFSAQHVRADRDYKLMRTLLYGRLEDERSFTSVKRLVENEDYLMRVFRDAGAPVVATYGFVEITPAREYMLVTDFSDGAHELGDERAIVDDAVIEQGLHLIRGLWDSGLAHRDVKPANLLVSHGRLVLIDLGFSQVRPTAWRQAVDLANMCLCLAARTDSARVYAKALEYFTAEDLAEAFAATKGLTVPTQLQAVMKADGRDLIGEFRALAPERPPIAIQRWSVRRVGLAAAVVAGALLVLAVGSTVFFSYDPQEVSSPDCAASTPALLYGQAVPTARYVPCVSALPVAWSVNDVEVQDGKGTMTVDAAALGTAAFTLKASCNVQGEAIDSPVPNDGVKAELDRDGARRATLALRYDGGCITVDLRSEAPTVDQLLNAVTNGTENIPRTVRLVDRERLNEAARNRTDGRADVLTRE